MRKVAAVFSIVFGVVVLAASTSRSIMEKITGYREALPWQSWLGNHQVNNVGDLVRMAYLENIPRFRDTVVHQYKRAGDGNKQVNLYLFGDSYVKDIPDSAFYGLKSFHFGRRDYTNLFYDLDTTQKNILIISLGERFLRRFLYFSSGIYQQVKKVEKTTAFYLPLRQQAAHKNYASFGIGGFNTTDFFNPAINQNIEYNLFSYNFVNPVREFKADLNARIFKRGSGDVEISEDGTWLFLKETMSPSSAVLESSYSALSNDGASYHISVLNEVYEHYKNEGFDEVYLSVIPNPVSVLQPALYNKLIPEVQNHERGYPIKMPVIDVYSVFVNDPRHYYLKGDTHWNPEGQAVWIEKVNAMLKAWDNNDAATHKLTW